MDQDYVTGIDSELESGHASPETKKMIRQVQAFPQCTIDVVQHYKGLI